MLEHGSAGGARDYDDDDELVPEDLLQNRDVRTLGGVLETVGTGVLGSAAGASRAAARISSAGWSAAARQMAHWRRGGAGACRSAGEDLMSFEMLMLM